MAYSLAQNPTVINTGSGTSISKAFASSTTAHSLLLAFVSTDAATPGTFTYTGGGTWASIGSVKDTTTAQWLSIGYCLDATGGSAPTIQAAWTGATNFNGMVIAEFTNTGVASAFDTKTTGTNGNSTTPTDSAMTVAGGIAVAWADSNGQVATAGSGFTLGTNNDGPDFAYWEYQLVSAGSVTAAYTLGSGVGWCILSAAFKPAGAAAPVINLTMAPITGY